MPEFQSFAFRPIAKISTCFHEKLGTPRQSGLARHATGLIKIRADFDAPSLLRGIETFSHLWIVSVFHRNLAQGWKATVEVPRESRDERVGVLASRSPHRPNSLGLSVVKLDGVDATARRGAELHVSGVDLLDGTPILDIKPYLPYADCLPEARSGWASEPIRRHPVSFSRESLEKIRGRYSRSHPQLEDLLREILEIDPRPTAQKKDMPLGDAAQDGREFVFRFLSFDVKWKIFSGALHVIDLVDSPRASRS